MYNFHQKFAQYRNTQTTKSRVARRIAREWRCKVVSANSIAQNGSEIRIDIGRNIVERSFYIVMIL